MAANLIIEPVSYDTAALLLRLTVGLALLPFPIKKILTRETEAEKFPKVPFFTPEAAFYCALVIELTASVSMIFGFLTRLIAIPAICNMAVATNVTRGKYFTSPAQAYLLGFISILIVGPGKYSLDWLFF
ncbi:MAG: DoxX family protein [Desulfovibrio sp.]|nr:DoxX family protein [Desulfovibrio sp.]